jgi:glycerate kinase
MTLRILIAPSGFKESLGAAEVADCIEVGILRALPDAKIRKAPLADGGEGFTKALVSATGGTLHHVTVTGPVGQPVRAHYGFLGNTGPKTAVLEMASAAGLRLVPPEARNPLMTTTFGVGELIKAALDAGAKRLLIGCGDSGTNDGGAGMAQALGVLLLDAAGKELGWGGGELARLEHIDVTGLDTRVERVRIDVACNVHNILCGPKGVARVFGPQKGAPPETVEQLAAANEHYADVIARELGIECRSFPGSGASGGLGTGLHAFLGATLHPWHAIVMRYLEVDSLLGEVDLVVTAEGAIDFQTPRGKVPAEVAQRAKRNHLPVIVLAGTIGKEADVNFACGIDSYSSILEAPCTLSQAIENTPQLLTREAERVMRLILVGEKLKTS